MGSAAEGSAERRWVRASSIKGATVAAGLCGFDERLAPADVMVFGCLVRDFFCDFEGRVLAILVAGVEVKTGAMRGFVRWFGDEVDWWSSREVAVGGAVSGARTFFWRGRDRCGPSLRADAASVLKTHISSLEDHHYKRWSELVGGPGHLRTVGQLFVSVGRAPY